MWLHGKTHLSFMGALLWKIVLQVNKQVCSCTAKKCRKKLSICQWVCLRRLTGVCIFVLSGLSEQAGGGGGGGGGGSRIAETRLFSEEKKGAEKCWGRISSCLFNSSLWMCVCLSETCCQKPLLTAPLASHDFVMSEEEREITGKIRKKKKTSNKRRVDGKRRAREDGIEREGVRGMRQKGKLWRFGRGPLQKYQYCSSLWAVKV